MRKLTALLSLLVITCLAYGQRITDNNTRIGYKELRAELLHLPNDTVKTTSLNADPCNQLAKKNGIVYHYSCDSAKWVRVGSVIDTTSLSNRINAKVDTSRFKDSLAVQDLQMVLRKGNIGDRALILDGNFPTWGRFEINANANGYNRLMSYATGMTAFRPLFIGAGATLISDRSGSIVIDDDSSSLQVAGHATFRSTVTVSPATQDVHAITRGQADSRYPHVDQSYSDPSWIFDLDWDKIFNTPTTLSGYGITDAINSDEKGASNGVAELDGSGKVPLSRINDALLGAVNYKGTYNASTNSPALVTPSTSNKGWYYTVNTAGNAPGFPVDTGDWVISNGAEWEKIDANNKVTSVAGKVGAVTIQAADITDLNANVIRNQAISGSPQTGAFDITGAARTGTMTSTEYNIGAFSTGKLTGNDGAGTANMAVGGNSVMTWKSDGTVTVNNIPSYSSASNAFVISDGGMLKYRTAAQVRSDIGAASSTLTLNDVATNGNTTNNFLQITGVNNLPASGAGIELFYQSGESYLQSYSRSAAIYQPINVNGSIFKTNATRSLFNGATDDGGSALQINGNARTTGIMDVGTGTGNGYVRVSPAVGANGWVGFYDPSGVRAGYIGSDVGNNMSYNAEGPAIHAFNTSGLERMRIDASGNVGIGTTSPIRKFVVSDGAASGIEIDPTADGIASIISYNRSTSAYQDIAINPHGGNVGIGTSDPQTELDVAGMGTFSNSVVSPTLQSPDASSLTLQSAAGEPMIFAEGGSVKMELHDGRLGIGQTPNSARASLLEVAGNVWSTDAYILGTGTTPTAEFGLSGSGTNGSAFVRTMGTGNLDLQTSANQTRIHINGTTGNVGIGTTSASSQLTVNGATSTSGLTNNGNSVLNGGVVHKVLNTGSSTITITTSDYLIVCPDAGQGTITATLPASPVIGQTFVLMSEAYSINLNANGGPLVKAIAAGNSCTVVYTGITLGWRLIAYGPY